MEEPDGLQSMGSRRVRHNWATSFSLSLFVVLYCRKSSWVFIRQILFHSKRHGFRSDTRPQSPYFSKHPWCSQRSAALVAPEPARERSEASVWSCLLSAGHTLRFWPWSPTPAPSCASPAFVPSRFSALWRGAPDTRGGLSTLFFLSHLPLSFICNTTHTA